MVNDAAATYAGVSGGLKAYSLKLAKYPAVVSDDHHVVYGTADVAVAEQLLAEFREAR